MKYAGLNQLKALLDAYLAALADGGHGAIRDALAEFLGEHPEVEAVTWHQGAGLIDLAFEITGGVRYLAAEDRLTGAAIDDVFDTVEYAAFADVLWAGLDVLVAKLGFDVSVRATREGVSTLPVAA